MAGGLHICRQTGDPRRHTVACRFGCEPPPTMGMPPALVARQTTEADHTTVLPQGVRHQTKVPTKGTGTDQTPGTESSSAHPAAL